MEVARETFTYEGIIKFREVPFSTREEWVYWCLPDIVNGKITRPARMSEREKERYTVSLTHNLLTLAGRQQILTYIGNPLANTSAFAQQFAIGNYPVYQINPNDASVLGEIFRAVPSLSNITGTQNDLSTYIGQTQGIGYYTNIGLYGVNASSTSGSGTLMTHAKATYQKTNLIPVVADYILILQ